MAITNINSEDRLVQQTFADHLKNELGWDSVYAYNHETLGPEGLLGRASERNVVLIRDLQAAIDQLNPDLPDIAKSQAIQAITQIDFARSLIQHNRQFYGYIRDGVPVTWQDDSGVKKHARVHLIDFRNPDQNRFLAVRELKIQGVRVPHYNRRADLVCYVNGLPLVFIELKAVYLNIRAGFDNNLTDYLNESTISHSFYHNFFLVVSNGDKARYGSITSKWEHFVEWKRNREEEPARLDAIGLLDGMLAKDKLLDLLENFVLFDDSKPGGTRKIVARNHQVMGVNNAVGSVLYQEKLKKEFPPETRTIEYSLSRALLPTSQDNKKKSSLPVAEMGDLKKDKDLAIIERAHPDLGKLGVFWHTQGSGKSYSMGFFAEKVRRAVPGNFTFLIMTDREDLDDQIRRTFIGCGITDQNSPTASSGKDLQEILKGNHRFIFSLIHKFNQPVKQPYSMRDDIIVISDEAHRTQSGKFARNMRLALPNASFIGFTGTPLFTYDHLTKRIFGNYVSKYDFKRSEEDQSTVRLIYENRGEKLGLSRLDLNDRIAEAIEQADLDQDQTALLEKLLGMDYEVITADDRLDKLAADFVGHSSTRWESGKSMIVCVDKVTCGRMYQRIMPLWSRKIEQLKKALSKKQNELKGITDLILIETINSQMETLNSQIKWMESTLIEIVISEAQNEVRDFEKWGFDIIPHRAIMKNGFETPDGKRVPVEEAFKDPDHPFRIAIICAMWLTGFDVECLSTLYIDKPMKAHNLMQAIARVNRIFPGKDCGVIVDYNGVLKSLREALAQYALGDEGDTEDEIISPIEELVKALAEAIEEAENHLKTFGYKISRLDGATGWVRIEALKDAVDALYASDEAKRRFEIMARQVFIRFKALLMEPAAFIYAERHDNIEAIYKKLQENRDTADVTQLLKELHRIVNEAIRTAEPGEDHAEGLTVDLSQIDFDKLREEFDKKVKRKRAALQDIRQIVEQKLAQMMETNPTRMDFNKKYQEIIADYNREKDRATVEETFAELVAFVNELDAEQRRAAEEGLNENELALFDLLFKDSISKADREKLKLASKDLLNSLRTQINEMEDWTKTTTNQAGIKTLILDQLYVSLPRPPFTEDEVEEVATRTYEYVWQRSALERNWLEART